MRANIALHNGDCMAALREMDDNQFDLAIVDPPYGINCGDQSRQKSRTKLARAKSYKYSGWDNKPPSSDYFEDVMRVSKNQIIFGANHFGFMPPSACWIVWNKINTGDFADCELAWSSFNTAVRKFDFRWNGMLQGDMKNKEHRIHPTQKPVALYKWLLNNYAKEGDTILDTHLGSGSIAIACWDMKFDLTGYELDEDYYKAACDRLEKHKAQGQLF